MLDLLLLNHTDYIFFCFKGRKELRMYCSKIIGYNLHFYAMVNAASYT